LQIRPDASGNESEWTKTWENLAGRPWLTQYADGAFEEMEYDNAGRLIGRVDPDGVTTLTYYTGDTITQGIDIDRDGYLDPAGIDQISRTTQTVTTRGADTVQRTTTEVWDENHNATPTLISQVDRTPDGFHTWGEQFGVTTEQTRTLDGTGGWTDTVINPDGTQTVTVSTLGRRDSVAWLDNTSTQVSQTTYEYDTRGRLWKMTPPRVGTTEYSYTARDQIQTVTAPAPESGQSQLVTTYTYDPMGRRTVTTLPDSTQTTVTYHPTGELATQSGAQTYPVEYTYTAQGRLETMTTHGQAGPAVTTWQYDPARGWLTAKIYDDGGSTEYTYTPAGRLASREWNRKLDGTAKQPGETGLLTFYAYDNAGTQVTIDYDDGITPDVLTIRDRLGRAVEVRQGALLNGEITSPIDTTLLTHDGVSGRVLSEQVSGIGGGRSGQRLLTRSYDPVSQRPTGFDYGTVADPDAYQVVQYDYDPAGRLDQLDWQSQGTGSIYAANYTFVPNSNLVQQLTVGGLTTTYAYEDGRNNVTGITNAALEHRSQYTYRYTLARFPESALSGGDR